MASGPGSTGASQAGHASVPVATCHELSAWRRTWRPANRSAASGRTGCAPSISRCKATVSSLGRRGRQRPSAALRACGSAVQARPEGTERSACSRCRARHREQWTAAGPRQTMCASRPQSGHLKYGTKPPGVSATLRASLGGRPFEAACRRRSRGGTPARRGARSAACPERASRMAGGAQQGGSWSVGAKSSPAAVSP